MSNQVPQLPVGKDPITVWYNKVSNAIPSNRMASGPGYRIQQTSRGTILRMEPVESGGNECQRMQVQSVQGDYITCKTYNGVTTGSTVIYVAKPVELRHSVTNEQIGTIAVTYTNYATASNGACTRTAAASGYDNQSEMVLPTYHTGSTSLSEIIADEPNGGTGVTNAGKPLTYMDTNRDARAWCQIA